MRFTALLPRASLGLTVQYQYCYIVRLVCSAYKFINIF
jgi:hypothetical protein